MLQVEIPAAEKEEIIISITDAAGKIINRKEMLITEAINAVTIQRSDMAKGDYLLIIRSPEGRQGMTCLFLDLNSKFRQM